MAGIIEKIKGFLFSPSETFDASKEDTLGDALKYYIILLLIFASLSAAGAFSLLAEFFGKLPGMHTLAGAGAAVAFIIVLIYELIELILKAIGGVTLGGLWLHIWVYLMGGRKGLTQTFKALMYGATPSLLLGWVPVIGFLAVIWGATPSLLAWIPDIGFLAVIIWALIVEIIGIRQLHEISTGKAVVAVILAIIIPLIVLFVILLPAMMPMIPHGHGIIGHYWHKFR